MIKFISCLGFAIQTHNQRFVLLLKRRTVKIFLINLLTARIKAVILNEKDFFAMKISL